MGLPVGMSGANRDGSFAIIHPVMDEPKTPSLKWYDVCSLEEIPDGDVLMRREGGEALIVYRDGQQVTCMPNYCPHRGYTFDGASVQDGVLMCPHHGYEFRLDTGECVTFSDMPLDMYPVRIRDGRVEVKLK
jgi:nitrite reductase/ring-hydroxylating ferredoxin subunit